MDVGDLVGGRTPEGAGIDPDRDFVRWLKVLVGRGTPEGEDIGPGRDSIGRCCWFRERDGKPNARGRGYRSGQGLRRGIQLGFREGGEKEVRQRERISARARTPSGDTTKIP